MTKLRDCKQFKHIWFIDTEYNSREVVCLCAYDILTEERREFWYAGNNNNLLYPFDKDDLLISYNFVAEMDSFLRMGWDIPPHIICLMAEFRLLTNTKKPKIKGTTKARQQASSYLDCLAYFDLPSISWEEKEKMRDLILATNNFLPEDKGKVLAYCWTDVEPRLVDFFSLNIEQAEWRGKYQACVAVMEQHGMLMDRSDTEFFENNRHTMVDYIIKENDEWGVYVNNKWNNERFAQILKDNGLYETWPKTGKTNAPSYREEVFESETHPVTKGISSLIKKVKAYKESSIEIDEDGRNRFTTLPFWTDTGRNQPKGRSKKGKGNKNYRFLHSLPKAFRSFMIASPGTMLANLDYKAQEHAVATALSGDPEMRKDYLSGDPYIAIGKRLAYIPPDATSKSHPDERDRLKVVNFVLCYGGGIQKMADGLEITHIEADSYMMKLKSCYKRFFRWQNEVVHKVWEDRTLEIKGGWRITFEPKCGKTQIVNWPIQAMGAEILRCAVINCTYSGLKILSVIHDAILFEVTSQAELDLAQNIMEQVSEQLLGLRVKVEPKVTTTRFIEDKETWSRFCEIRKEVENSVKTSENIDDKIVDSNN